MFILLSFRYTRIHKGITRIRAVANHKKITLLHRDKPLFGIDIGRSSVKVIQLDKSSDPMKPRVIGYGSASTDPHAIEKGVIVDPESIVRSVFDLITKNIVGSISTRRVALSLPNEHCFSRIIPLPKMDSKDIASAVASEAESSIPVPLDQLYYDYEVMQTKDPDTVEVQLVATPKNIVDSYLAVAEALGLEVAHIETNITAVTRVVAHSEPVKDVVTLIIDFGSTAADLSIFDGKTARITGTADCGSDRITDLISQKLGVSSRQAYTIKNRFGIEFSKKQKDIAEAIDSELSKLINEVKKVQRYYADHSPVGEIGQIIILGGGATLPGFSTYITDHIRVPTRLCNPWGKIDFGRLQPPSVVETTMYATCSGLALIAAKELES